MSEDFRPDPRLTEEESPEDLDAEIRFHLEERVRELQEAGWSEPAARREALRRFGDVHGTRAAMAREDRMWRWKMGWTRWTGGLGADLKVAARQWRKRPGAGMIALLTLALGIGATTSIFSLVDGILLRPPPYPAPDRLAVIWSDWTERGGPEREWFGYPELHDLRTQVAAFEEVGIWTDPTVTLTGRGDARQLVAMVATEGTLSRVLRLTPAQGRFFTPEEDVPDGPPTVVVSWEFWQTTLGGDPEILGQSLILNGEPQEIIGVLPRGFLAPFGPSRRAEVWMTPGIAPNGNGRGNASWRAVGRMTPGTTIEQANEELRGFIAGLREIYPEAYVGKTPVAWEMRDDVVRGARKALDLLFGAVLVVLLLASVNVANLLLARNTLRQSELAVRAALGAGRRRIVRQLFVETGLLVLSGGLAGVALGWLGTRILVALAPAGTPRIESVALDGRVLGFAVVVTLLTTLLTGLLPASRAGRRDLRDALVGSGRDPGADRRGIRLRGVLVAGQVGLAVTLIAMAGLIGRSFSALRAVDLGFDPSDVLTFQLSFPGEAYGDPEERAAFQDRIAERLGALPGVRTAGGISNLPLNNANGDVGYTIEGRPLPEPGEGKAIWFRRVASQYMVAMDLRLVAGRGIEPTDVRGTPPVIVINETMARIDFPGENPIGQRINLGDPADPLWFEIVGIAADVRNFDIRDDWREAGYVANGQFPGRVINFTLEVEEGIDPTSLVPGIRSAVSEMDAGLAVTAVRPMTELVDSALGPDRFLAVLLAGFALLALTLAVVGLYGVVSYAVTSRLREVGVRIALGAEAGRIRRLVVVRGMVPVATGIAVGVLLTIGASRLVTSVVYGVAPLDAVSLGGTVVLLVLTAATAAAVPAIRASRVDPIQVLRDD